MINVIVKEKIKNFYKIVNGLQEGKKKEPALLIVQNETLSEIAGLAENPNLVTILDLFKDADFEEVIDQLANAMRTGKIMLMRLHNYLPPKIYNQLYLLAQDGHMEYPHLEERIFVDAVPNARIIIISTDAEIEHLNYSNILDLMCAVERL